MVGALAVILMTAGCKTWEPTTLGPGQVFDETPPSQVRLTLLEGEPLLLRDPELARDTIFGTIEMPGNPRHGARTRIPVHNVRQIEVRTRTDPVATGAGIAVGSVVVGFLAWLLILATADLG